MQITDAQQQVENMKNEIYIKSDNSKVNENLLVDNERLKIENINLMDCNMLLINECEKYKKVIESLDKRIESLLKYLNGDKNDNS